MASYYWNYETGNDSTGDGTTALPWKTLHYAISQGSTGDTIYPTDDFTDLSDATGGYGIRCGTALTVDCTGYTVIYKPTSADINLMFDITAGATIKNLALDGDSLTKADEDCYGFYINSNDVTLENCSIDNIDQAFTTNSEYNYGIYINSKTGIVIDALTITDLGSTATKRHYWLYGHTGSQAYIRNSSFTYTGGSDTDVALDWAVGDAAGRTLTVESTLFKCTGTHTNNLVHMAAGQMWLSRCTFWDTQTGSTQGPLVNADIGTSSTRGLTAHNCVFVGPNCVSVANSTGTYSIQNNIIVPTVDTSGTFGVRFGDANCENAGLLDYNQYWVQGSDTEYGIITGVGDYATFAAWATATSQDANSADGTPAFTNYATGDFTLTSASACINAGTDVGLGYVGSAPDMGRYELTVSTNQMTGIYDFKMADGTQHPLCVAAGTVHLFDRTPEDWESGYTAIGAGFTANTNSFWDFVTDSDTCWMLGASEALHKWNGVTETSGTITLTQGDATVAGSSTDFSVLGTDGKIHVTLTGEVLTISSITNDTGLELTAAYAGATQAGLEYVAYTYQASAGSPPTGKYLALYNNYLFVAGNATNTSRVYWSNLKDFETWGGSDFIDINRKDGDPVTGMFVLGDYLYIGKEDTLWRLNFTGDSLFPFTLDKVADVGLRSHWSVKGAATVKFFLSGDGVYMIAVNGLPQKVSFDIEPDVLATTVSGWDNVSALFHPEYREYWILFRDDDILFMYDVAQRGWAKWTAYDFNIIGEVEATTGAWQGYGGDAYGNIYTLDTGTSDNSAAIDFQVDSRAYDFGAASVEKQVPAIIVQTDEAAAWTMTLSHRTDFSSWNSQTVLSTGDQTSGSGISKQRLFLTTDTIGRFFEFRFRNNQADIPFTLYMWAPLIKALGRR